MFFFSDGGGHVPFEVPAKSFHNSGMSRECRRSKRIRTQPIPTPSTTTPAEPSQPSDRSSPSTTTSRESSPAPVPPAPHKPRKGDRYLIPRSIFFDDGDPDALLFAVVTGRRRGKTALWFEGDTVESWYDGMLEEWTDHFVPSSRVRSVDENKWYELEVVAKLRAPDRPARQEGSRRGQDPPQTDQSSPSDEDGGPVEVESWEGDDVDDEQQEGDDVDDEQQEGNNAQYEGDGPLEDLVWEDAGALRNDPRAEKGQMPEGITPAFRMPNFRDATLLEWFFWWFPLTSIDEIVEATNEHAKTISWRPDNRWRHLRRGEFLVWLGLWLMMTVFQANDQNRRSYWGPLMDFGKMMARNRFESILRAFSLPQYEYEDPEWGGEGRKEYEKKKFDPFFRTRKFTDAMRKRFQDAMKPGGWLCVDECMFSWLGRALKLPGWKMIKRKPHPFGLESKTTACSATGILIDFEFQEGKDVMQHFEYITETNKSSAWLLRMTKRWHNMEGRTVIADAAFGQVRVAFALWKKGLYFIGNVKTAHKFFPKAELKSETPAFSGNALVCLTKKATARINSDESVTMYATGWRATTKMVCTYIHTGGTNNLGTDRKKRRHTQMSDGTVRDHIYHVKRPKVSSEYQSKMGAIDGHNFRRQSGKGVRPLEKVWVSNDSKDRIFINIVGWVIVNMFLAHQYFVGGGGNKKKTASAFQADVATCLINNQYAREAMGTDDDDVHAEGADNDPEDCVMNPHRKSNWCKICHNRRTLFICRKCSKPKAARLRKDKGRAGGDKFQHDGYMHFCKVGCFAKHKCGHVPLRRKKRTRGMESESDVYDVYC